VSGDRLAEIKARLGAVCHGDQEDVAWLVAEVERLRGLLRQVAEHALVEAAAGAPADMVALYVSVEVEHAVAGHDGNAQDCDSCIIAVANRR
jgi:hypothetical protein